jgi:hypothetical protein
MTKTCPECKSKSTRAEVFCASCYHRFGAARGNNGVWKYRLASIAAGLTVAICRYLIVN